MFEKFENFKKDCVKNIGWMTVVSGMVLAGGVTLVVLFPPAGVLYWVAVGGIGCSIALTSSLATGWLMRQEEKEEGEANVNSESVETMKSILGCVGRIESDVGDLKNTKNEDSLKINKLHQQNDALKNTIDTGFELQAQNDAAFSEEVNVLIGETKSLKGDIKNLQGDLKKAPLNPHGMFPKAKQGPDDSEQQPSGRAHQFH